MEIDKEVIKGLEVLVSRVLNSVRISINNNVFCPFCNRIILTLPIDKEECNAYLASDFKEDHSDVCLIKDLTGWRRALISIQKDNAGKNYDPTNEEFDPNVDYLAKKNMTITQ